MWNIGSSLISGSASLLSTGMSAGINVVGQAFSSTKNALSGADMLYQVTKQMVLESVGQGKQSDDPVLQAKIDKLNEIKNDYDQLVKLGTLYCNQFDAFADTMNALGNLMFEMSLKEQGTCRISMNKVADAYRATSKHENSYNNFVRTFYENIALFRAKALEDTLDTVKKYEESRFLFDVYDNQMKQLATEDPTKPGHKERLEEIKPEYDNAVKTYVQLKRDLNAKIDILNMKRETDMEVQMNIQFRNMIAFYQQNLESFNKFAIRTEIKKEETQNSPVTEQKKPAETTITATTEEVKEEKQEIQTNQ